MNTSLQTIKKITPPFIWNFARSSYVSALDIVANFGPYIRSVKYCGVDFYYGKNDATIRRLKTETIFEKEMCDAIVRELSKKSVDGSGVFFLDIGCNIGLISVYVHSKLPKISIHAFEPGTSQREFFAKTIEVNHLTTIYLHKEALGDKEGEATFYIHDPKYASLDGFKDTKRRGETKPVQVPITTLDTWWNSAGKPRIPVVKIDTEGAEFLILSGASSFIQEVQPVIFLEIEPRNLHAYSHTYKDILQWFVSQKYTLETLSGTLITEQNFENFIGKEDTYLARPSSLRQ